MTSLQVVATRALCRVICVLAITLPALAQPDNATERPPGFKMAVAQAEQWIASPAREERIAAFAPAADIRYRVYESPKPLRLWIARIDLATPGVRLALTEPAEFTGDDAKFETRCATTLDFAQQRGVQLAINASAFAPFRSHTGMPMDVVGLAAVRGKAYSGPDKRFGALYISRGGRISLKGPPLPTEDVWHVVPGFRLLLDDGRIAVTPRVAESKFGGVNPRTAVGVDQQGRTLWLVVVDGRQSGVSAGITLVELACLFQSLNVWDALNVDGGGSSTLVLEDATGVHRVINTPVGRGKPGSLRQVANNLGLYLPGVGPTPVSDPPETLRTALIRTASARRGGGYARGGDGVSQDLVYEGETILRANPEGTYCCGATLEAFLDAYRRWKPGAAALSPQGRWFEDWPKEKFVALQQGWYGTEGAPTNPLLPEEVRPTIREKQMYHVVPWTGLATPVDDYRLLRRGDFVQFWRKNRTGHSVIFWGRDRDEAGRERLWYWSSQRRPRHAYPLTPGGEPTKTPGFGISWEFVGEDIDPSRIYGAAPADATSP
jgi:hypothetical protein